MKPAAFFSSYGNRTTRVWWVIVSFFSWASIVDVAAAPVFGFSPGMQAFFLTAVSAMKATLIMLVAIAAWRKRWLRWAVVTAGVIFALLATVNAGSSGLYGFGFSRKLLNLAMQSNPDEATELIPDILFKLKAVFSRWQTWVTVAIGGAMVLLFRRLPKHIFRIITGAGCAAGAVLTIWFAARFTTGRTALFLSMRIPKYTYDMIQSNRELEKYIANQPELPEPETVSSERLAANIILMIGESANRDNLSAYGYELETSPEMDLRSDSLFLFRNVISSSVYTLQNIENMMTFRPDNRPETKWTDYPRVLDLFKTAGYRTSWLSNQERAGWWANSMGALSATADNIKFIGLEYPEDAMLANAALDEQLLAPTEAAIDGKAECKFIVVHLMGSHWIYSERYPAEHARFTSADVLGRIHSPWLNEKNAAIVAEYANSLAYTDSIWGAMARIVEQRAEPSLLIYVSDHGENVFNDRDFRGRDSEHARIPFVILANGPYRQQNPEIVSRIRSALDSPFSSAALVHLLMTLTGTSYSLYDAENDPLSGEFQERIRYVDDEPWIHDKKHFETEL